MISTARSGAARKPIPIPFGTYALFYTESTDREDSLGSAVLKMEGQKVGQVGFACSETSCADDEGIKTPARQMITIEGMISSIKF
jgi:hypothetical protein